MQAEQVEGMRSPWRPWLGNSICSSNWLPSGKTDDTRGPPALVPRHEVHKVDSLRKAHAEPFVIVFPTVFRWTLVSGLGWSENSGTQKFRS